MHWVWMKSTPALTFLARRWTRHSKGSANGLAAAPMKICGRPSISAPLRNLPSSRICRTMPISWVESMSKTPLAMGWSPNWQWSPDRQSMLRMPRAEAPRMSACIARRLRSRQTIWKLGSRPSWISSRLAAQLDMRTMAVWLSVMFTESTLPLRWAAFLRTSSAWAPRGGPSSPVNAKCPARSTFSKLLPDFISAPSRMSGGCGRRDQALAFSGFL